MIIWTAMSVISRRNLLSALDQVCINLDLYLYFCFILLVTSAQCTSAVLEDSCCIRIYAVFVFFLLSRRSWEKTYSSDIQIHEETVPKHPPVYYRVWLHKPPHTRMVLGQARQGSEEMSNNVLGLQVVILEPQRGDLRDPFFRGFPYFLFLWGASY